MPNAEAAIGMLRSGEINFLTDFSGDPKVVLDAAEADGDLEVVSTVDMGFRYIGFNERRPPFDDPAFRRALSASVDRRLIAARLHTALVLRERLYPTPHYRCCYGESDLLPGLVLDRYGDVVVGQITTAGMEVLRPDIEAAIRDVLAPATLVWKNDSAARTLEGLPETVTTAWGGTTDDVEAIEHPGPGRSLRFLAPLAAGQKTGWFYDQAWNRARLARYLGPGARVLDVCSYAGGWAITAATQGAASVSCIDSSQRALDAVARNATAHGVDIKLLRGDAFDVLASLASAGRRFDAVIVDPPAFIKRRKDIPAGQAAYRRLNQLALRVLAGDALLVSCSCSYHLEPQALLAAIQGAARHAGRFVQVLEAGGQSPDHPVHPAITETRYLKAYFCRVTGE